MASLPPRSATYRSDAFLFQWFAMRIRESSTPGREAPVARAHLKIPTWHARGMQPVNQPHDRSTNPHRFTSNPCQGAPFVTMAGVPAANASATVMPKFSEWVGKTNKSASLYADNLASPYKGCINSIRFSFSLRCERLHLRKVTTLRSVSCVSSYDQESPIRKAIHDPIPSPQQDIDALDGVDPTEEKQCPRAASSSLPQLWNVDSVRDNDDRLLESQPPYIFMLLFSGRVKTRCLGECGTLK